MFPPRFFAAALASSSVMQVQRKHGHMFARGISFAVAKFSDQLAYDFLSALASTSFTWRNCPMTDMRHANHIITEAAESVLLVPWFRSTRTTARCFG